MQSNITPTNAIRVWAGFRLTSLTAVDFYKTLGDTFIPGTLYMLRPLGINAYNICALVHDQPNLPSECALVVYRSRNAYRAITRENLHGRVHRASHYAVFDMQRSRASFPEKSDTAPPGTDTLYLFDKDVDWQQGFLHFSLIKNEKLTSTVLLEKLPQISNSIRDYLQSKGFAQAIVLVREQFITLWTYRLQPDMTPANLQSGLKDTLPGFDVPYVLPAETFPSFTPNPELMYIEKDAAIQFKYTVAENSFIY